ncbi:S-layer homology domain-containing protein [Paenibacillus gorillae]|uniref:S-layer homology domain-containing protein n=1 Tax=Paenibacillus gorillae TaxID=1243662 RepID=UPI0004B8E88E|nr:S-layer homology domain-containing protein [Paenibacillus gorillae]
MKKKRFSLMTAFLLLIMTLAPSFAAVQEAAAAETWIDVSTPAELDEIRNHPSENFRLIQDIDLSGYANWSPIGVYNISPFTGKFDGQGHTISNLTIDRPGDNNIGLFAQTNGASITNVHLTNVNVRGNTFVGGLVGDFTSSQLSGSSVSGTVTGHEAVGGMAGYSSLSSIADSYTTGSIAGDTSAADELGGIAGYATFSNTKGFIRNVYSSAVVNASSNSGGLIGKAEGAPNVSNAHWDTETSGRLTSSGGGVGHPTADMKRKATFAGWDFTNTWGIVEEATSPLLLSQFDSIALDSLSVANAADSTAIPIDRVFSSNYGIYHAQVVSQIDHLNIAGTAKLGTSTVSINNSSSLETVALNPGANTITIKVTSAAGLTAEYKLHVTRDAGTAQFPHRISTAAQLADLSHGTAGYGMNHIYELEADLDLSGYADGDGWLPIGSSSVPFTGIFHGNQHTIANLKVNRPLTDEVGLFGRTDGAQITDLAITNVHVTGNNSVGGLIGTSINTTVNYATVHGAVYGNDSVAGLVGELNGASQINYALSTAYVSAPASGITGGLVADVNAGSIMHSFWDTETSQQSTSSGGATGKTTSDLMKKSTYTSDNWSVGSGQSWDMIEGTGYPMPKASFAKVTLSGLTLSTPGASHSLGSFDAHTGLYTATLNTPVTTAVITATPAVAGSTVTLNGGSSSSLNLHLGDNTINVLVTSQDGLSQGLYSLKLTVPTPQIQSVQVPPNGTYGIGQDLNFTVTFNHPVDVTGMPLLPIHLNSSNTNAAYTGQPAGQLPQLTFTYTVKAGDLDSDGIALGSSLTAAAPAAITSIGDSVPLALAGVPSLSGVLIDGVLPSIVLTPSTTAPTNGALIVQVTADGTGSAIRSLKWAAGSQTASYFASGGTVVDSGQFEVPGNGTYTVYAEDAAGNNHVETITISNIVNGPPTIVLDYTPKAGKPTNVEITVAATANAEASGNSITDLRWAPGELNIDSFSNPAFGTAVAVSNRISITQNGKYTVYAKDSIGNEQVSSIEITAIVANLPPESGSGTYTPPVSGQFVVVPGQAYTLNYGSMTLHIPVGAVTQKTTISIQNATSDAQKLLGTDQALLSDAYRLTKDVDGKFASPITITMTRSSSNVDSGQTSAVFYYDEAAKKWQRLPGNSAGTTIAGETDHFTLFAVLSVTENPGSTEPSFNDIAGHWAEKEIQASAALGWVNGYPNGSFLPNRAVTRAEFAVMLSKVLQLPAAQSLPFDDANSIPDWAASAIASAAQAGILSGYEDRTFRPNVNISRAEAAVMIAKAAGLSSTTTNTTFADDAQIAGWARGWVAAAAKAQLVQGQASNAFLPQASTTRAEAVVLLQRLNAVMN